MASVPEVPCDSLAVLAEGGEMGERIRGYDWASTPLGPPAGWPQALKTAVGILLSSKFPMFLAWGAELRFLYNDAYVDVLGGKHPAALGHAFEDIWAEIWSDIHPLVQRALAGEATYWENLPLTMTRKGYEEQTWFTFSYSPLRGDGGEVEGMFCACVETTDTVLAARRRVSEAERLRRLFDHAPSFMAVLRGPDLVFEMMNASYLQLVGHRDLVGKPVREALPEVEGQGFFELLDEVYRSGEAFTGLGIPIQLQREPGAPAEERLVDFVFQPITDADGSVSGIFAEGYDVTERHVAEEALRESEARFRLIADSAPVPMWVTRLDRTRSFVNRAYVEFLGISYEEAISFDWRTVIHPEDAPRILAESLAGEARLERFELVGRYRSHGEWRWIRSVSQPRWGAQGEHVGFIGVAHDVTELKRGEAALREVNETLERRVAERTGDLSAALDRLQAEVGERLRAEEALRQAQKMEAVGQLTGGIAHDFNNLLTVIGGNVDAARRHLGTQGKPRVLRALDNALIGAERAATLTQRLLAFSRRQPLNPRPIDVNRLVTGMSELFHRTLGETIAVETRLPDGLWQVEVDPNQLENAILNLAVNARDAMPNGGKLTIETANTDIDREHAGRHGLAPGQYAALCVSDIGSGMAAD
ncbi:MAG: PAS domain-containing protein, partial [Alphaproteobacteria bacterium]|nr:PAS domain-containing protein [Alphaproteobacteria bacterium]